jgi:hypothetical protein
MGAILSRNAADGKSAALPDELKIREVVQCRAKGCTFSYTLAASSAESGVVEDNENSLDRLRRQAPEVVIEGHPDHNVEAYIWGGPMQGWVTSERANRAGI